MAITLSGALNTFGLENAPNVLTGGLTDQPDWTPSNLDPGTIALINQMNQQGQMTPEQIQAQMLQGTSATMASPATGGAVAQQQSTLGGPEHTAVTQALNDRANRLYASQYSELQNAAKAATPMRQGQLMSQASNALQQQQNINDQLNRQQMAATLQKWGMRNQVIGQILSGAGSFAGTYAGMQGGRGAGDAFAQQLQGQLNNTNFPQYTSDPNQPYNLTGDPSSINPGYNLGVDTSGFTTPQDAQGYYGMTPPKEGQGYNGNQPYGGYVNQNPSGYGLGVSYNGLQ